MKREDISKIAEDVVEHLLPTDEDNVDDAMDEKDEAFMQEAARLLWEAVRNPEMNNVRAFVVKRDADGKVVLETEK